MADIDFSELKANPKNPRKISEFDFKNLVQSIREFGDLSCVVYNVASDQLVGGHQRVEAFKAIQGEKKITYSHRHYNEPDRTGTVASGYIVVGDSKFPYREVNWPLDAAYPNGDKYSTKENAANIAANRIQGNFDIDLLAEVSYQLQQDAPDLVALTGQSDQEIDQLLDMVGAKGETEDEAPTVDDVNSSKSELGKVYLLGRHRVMCGDATSLDDVNTLMAGKQAEIVFTDPPYNVAYEGKTEDALTIQNDRFKDSEAFYDFLYLAFSNLNAVTKDGSPIYICHADSEGFNFRKAMMESGWTMKQCIIWNKNTMVMGRQDYQWKHEPILYGWKEGAAHYFVNDRNLTTVWEFDKPSASKEHPTMKPIALVRYALTNSSKREALVLDTFGGSGSTLMAADEVDRTCYTMELDPKYVDVIRKRYAIKQDRADDWEAFTPSVE